MSISNDELDLLPTYDLIEALKRRFPEFVFLGLTDRGQDSEHYDLRYAGHKFTLIGLGYYIANEISKKVDYNPEAE